MSASFPSPPRSDAERSPCFFLEFQSNYESRYSPTSSLVQRHSHLERSYRRRQPRQHLTRRRQMESCLPRKDPNSAIHQPHSYTTGHPSGRRPLYLESLVNNLRQDRRSLNASLHFKPLLPRAKNKWRDYISCLDSCFPLHGHVDCSHEALGA